MPLNDSGKEITEDDDIFIDDPKQLVSRDLSLPRRDISRDLQLVACGASAYTSSDLRHTHCPVPSMCERLLRRPRFVQLMYLTQGSD